MKEKLDEKNRDWPNREGDTWVRVEGNLHRQKTGEWRTGNGK